MNCLKVFFIVVGVFLLLFTGTQTSYSASQKGATSPVDKIKKESPLASEQPSSQKKKKQKTKPSPITKPLNLQPVKGYCCAQGTFYSRITRAECQRKKGHYSSNKESIKSNCGWCCKDGKVRSVSSAEEKKKRCATGAKLHKTEGLADRNCGWCCKTKGIVVASLRSECDVKKFHQEKSEAEKQCKPPSGYCNVRGKTLKRISPERCKRLGGTFYKRFALANRDLLTLIRQEALNETRDTRDDNQQEPLIWCCDDGDVSRITKEECVGTKKKPLNGTIFKTQKEALNACRNLGLTRAQRFERFNPAGVKPALLADLEIVKTSTNRQCFMTVRVKNKGGPISSSNHGASTIHLSAGPGAISGKTQLTDIDPGGVLKSAGGEITATTELRITKASQATLTWVDTNHQIVESNETNNGDDAVLSCKTPLIWCCLNKQTGMIGGANQVGQMTLGECKKIGGISHNSESAANTACGIKPPLRLKLSSTQELKENKKDQEPDKGPKKMMGKMIPEGLLTGPPPESVPTSLDRGILITSPSSRHQFYPGESFGIEYIVTTEVEPGDIRFSILNSSEASIGSTTISYDPASGGTVPTLTIPTDTPSGLYKIRADHLPSDAHGEGDSFFVAGSAAIEFIDPGRGDRATPGRDLEVSIRLSHRVEPGTITFELHTIRNRTSLSTVTLDYTPGSATSDPSDSSEYTVDLPIPESTRCEDCMISATHPRALGTSSTFSVQTPTVDVRAPLSREHWESCSGGTVVWRYQGDPSTIPSIWEIEFLREGSRQFLYRSRCSDFSDGYPPQRRCTERVVTPCLPTGSYTVRVSGDGLAAESATFRIGITDDWPMISISEPRSQAAYYRENPLPVSLFSTAAVDVEIEIQSTRGGAVGRILVDGVIYHTGSFRIPAGFRDGQYNFLVYNRSNRDNYAQQYFFITDRETDFSIRNATVSAAGRISAEVHVQSRPRVFEGEVEFHVETIRPYRSWFVTRRITGRAFPSAHWERVDLGDFETRSGDSERYPLGIEYRITIDGSDDTRESNEDNNVATGRFVP